MRGKALVVDANILVRAVLGKRTRQVIEAYAGSVSFFIPEIAYRDAEEHPGHAYGTTRGRSAESIDFFAGARAIDGIDRIRDLRRVRSGS